MRTGALPGCKVMVGEFAAISEIPVDNEVHVLDKFPALKWYPQQEEWVRDPCGSDNSCFNYPLALRLEGVLNRGALRQALQEIVRRHQVFRSVFGIEAQEVIRMVLQPHAVSVAEVDLEPVCLEDRQSEALRLAVQDAQKPFDLTLEPLLRATLLRLDTEECILLLMTHHFACDDWSIDILLGELSDLYSEFSNGRPSSLPEINYQYSDFVRQHTSEMQGDEQESRLRYWRQQYDGAGRFYYLSTDYPRPARPAFLGGHEAAVLPELLDAGIKRFSQTDGISPFVTLVGGLLCILGGYSGREDIGVGICVANRNHFEAEELIGPFSNRLLLRAKVTGTLTSREMLEGVRSATWDAYSFQEVPFGELLEEVASGSKADCSRLFQMLIVFENAPRTPREFAGLKVSRFPFDTGRACYDLHVWLRNQDGLQITIKYDVSLFAPETIRRIMNDYQRILKSIISEPDGLVKNLSVSLPAGVEYSLPGVVDVLR